MDGCYRFSDTVYKFILRNMKHQMPAEVTLEVILPIVSLLYTLQQHLATCKEQDHAKRDRKAFASDIRNVMLPQKVFVPLFGHFLRAENSRVEFERLRDATGQAMTLCRIMQPPTE